MRRKHFGKRSAFMRRKHFWKRRVFMRRKYFEKRRVFHRKIRFWDKEKTLITSIESFSPKCFLSFSRINFKFSVTFELWFAIALNLDKSKNLSFSKELNLPNDNFRLVQIESICRQHIKSCSNYKFVHNRIENIVGQGENAG